MVFGLAKIQGFDWDKGNIDKNIKKHNVTDKESEEVFTNQPLVSKDEKHSENKERFQALGVTNRGRLLFVSFTIRKIDNKLKIRVISARDTNKKERAKYEKV